MTRIAVVGASTPFVLPLFDALAEQSELMAQLSLFGRNPDPLTRVAWYARNALPHWPVSETTHIEEALSGADVIILQARVGGLEGRRSDERIAEALGVAADETLGPSGLHASLRMSRELRSLAHEIRVRCPSALVLNLINPLSISTALLGQESVRAVGLCELPVVTHQSIARILECEPTTLAWSYSGLNHRGFLHGLTVDGSSVLPHLARELIDRDLLGVLGDEVQQLSAVPLKYFGLLSGYAPHGAGRARTLMSYKDQALRDLAATPLVSPKVLASRPSPWYSTAVVPFVTALVGETGFEGTANLRDATGIVREYRVLIRAGELVVLEDADAPESIHSWLTRLEDHERAVLAAVDDPTYATIHRACELDPLLPHESLEEAVQLVLASSARTLEEHA